MHLWPSLKLRDSFKIGHLRKLERFNNHKKQDDDDDRSKETSDRNQQSLCRNFPFCRDLILIFTCCFCFGIFRDEDEIDYI